MGATRLYRVGVRGSWWAVAIGGVLGASLRWAVLDVLPQPAFPWPTLMVNMLGSAALGLALVALTDLRWRAFAGAGICGGFTTMSTFAVQTADLLGDDRVGLGLAYLVTTVTACLLAAALGAGLGGRMMTDPTGVSG